MTTENMIKGLQILMPYYSDPAGNNSGAEHDVLYAYPTNRPLLKIDINKMVEFGWHQEHDGRDYNKDYSYSDYREDESWMFYT